MSDYAVDIGRQDVAAGQIEEKPPVYREKPAVEALRHQVEEHQAHHGHEKRKA